MKSAIVIVTSILAVLVAVFVLKTDANKEGFTADGWIYNVPSEWFRKPAYNINEWFVAYNPEQIPNVGGCDMYYRGDPRELNYLSSAYRFWRF